MPRGVPRKGYREYTGRWSKFNPNFGKEALYPAKEPGAANDGQPFRIDFKVPGAPVVEAAQVYSAAPTAHVHVPLEPCIDPSQEILDDLVIEKRINVAFTRYERMFRKMIRRKLRALIVSGNAGSGKSYLPELILKEYDEEGTQSQIIKGFSRNTGLYQALYRLRNPGQITIFDDCDSVFLDANGLQLIKAATDSTEKRWLSWGALTRMTDDFGNDMPTKFLFEGHVVFITNYDFDKGILRGGGLAEHFQALQSRSYYLDLGIHSRKASFIRIRMLMDTMFPNHTEDQKREICNYIYNNLYRFREVPSLRTAIKIAELMDDDSDQWKSDADGTLLKDQM